MPWLLTFPPPGFLTILAAVLTILTGVFSVCFLILEWPLRPYNSFRLEFARTPAGIAPMFAKWGPAGIALARRSLHLDFWYMPCYAFTLASWTILAARAAQGWTQDVGLWLVLAPFGAWAFDILENLGLLRATEQPLAPPAGPLARSATAAAIKFGLLILTIVYIAAAFWLFRR